MTLILMMMMMMIRYSSSGNVSFPPTVKVRTDFRSRYSFFIWIVFALVD